EQRIEPEQLLADDSRIGAGNNPHADGKIDDIQNPERQRETYADRHIQPADKHPGHEGLNQHLHRLDSPAFSLMTVSANSFLMVVSVPACRRRTLSRIGNRYRFVVWCPSANHYAASAT